MLKQLQKTKDQKGFTIIEVLIVLAIAGLILLIVFLAVPALQRNSRNTQRKNDVAALLAGVSEVSNNNNGKQAATCSGASSPVLFDTNPAGTSAEAKVGFYNLGCAAGAATVNGHVGILASFAATGPYNTATQDMVTLVPSASCSATNTAVAGAARSWVAIFLVEKGAGTYASACQEG